MNREEAIKVLNSRPYTGEVREALETLIPELKESEDERIRKTLINALKTSKSVGELKFVLSEPTREECITYLEKQKEQKPLSTEETELNSIAFLERMGYTCVPPGAKQKPAEWSEEDEDMRDTIIRDLKRLGGDLVKVNPAYKEEINWLKLLPKRFILQPKAEWSKEDSKRYISIRTTLETSAVLSKEDYDANVVWLRDLVNAIKYSGPKPSWKPSEEQMKEYSYWYRNFIESGLASPTSKAVTVLGELLEQLKKLI